jgi:hypothetical protein
VLRGTCNRGAYARCCGAQHQNHVAVTQPKTVTKRVVPINNELSRKVLDYIRENGQAKTGSLVDALGMHKNLIIRNLNKLIEDGQIHIGLFDFIRH